MNKEDKDELKSILSRLTEQYLDDEISQFVSSYFEQRATCVETLVEATLQAQSPNSSDNIAN